MRLHRDDLTKEGQKDLLKLMITIPPLFSIIKILVMRELIPFLTSDLLWFVMGLKVMTTFNKMLYFILILAIFGIFTGISNQCESQIDRMALKLTRGLLGHSLLR